MADQTEVWEWLVFGGIVAILLGIDLLVHRVARAESRKWALLWSAIWTASGLAGINGGGWEVAPLRNTSLLISSTKA